MRQISFARTIVGLQVLRRNDSPLIQVLQETPACAPLSMRRAAPPAAQDGHPTRPNSGRPRRRLKKSGIQWWLVATICAALNGIAEGENPARPSIIMISIDTLRADHLGVYGYAKIH